MSDAATLLAYRRLYGFRLSVVDVVAIGLGVGGCMWLWKLYAQFALLLPIVLFHFFLFCNVFRVRRAYELIWAAVFMVNFGAQIVFWAGSKQPFNWWIVGAIQVPVTVVVIGMEMRSAQYHGIGCQRINPHLLEYLKVRITLPDITPGGPRP